MTYPYGDEIISLKMFDKGDFSLLGSISVSLNTSSWELTSFKIDHSSYKGIWCGHKHPKKEKEGTMCNTVSLCVCALQ